MNQSPSNPKIISVKSPEGGDRSITRKGIKTADNLILFSDPMARSVTILRQRIPRVPIVKFSDLNFDISTLEYTIDCAIKKGEMTINLESQFPGISNTQIAIYQEIIKRCDLFGINDGDGFYKAALFNAVITLVQLLVI